VPSEIPSRFPRNGYEPVEELDIPPTGHRIRRRSSGLDRGTRRLAVIAGGIGRALQAGEDSVGELGASIPGLHQFM